MHHHHMSFYWDTNIGEFLFPGLNINGPTAVSGLCIVLLVLTIIYEAIKVQQVRSRARAARERLKNQTCPAGETARLLSLSTNGLNRRQLFLRKFAVIAKQALIFLSQNTLGYILMLSVMVYNVFIFLIVIFGLGLGYFLFGHISMKTNMENIRARTTHVICSPRCPTEPTTSGNQNNDNQQGYINQIAVSSSSSENSSSCDTQSQSTQLTKIEVHPSDADATTNTVMHSCHL